MENSQVIEWSNAKNTNVIASLDMRSTEEILQTLREIGDHIIGIKLHSDLIQDATDEFFFTLKKVCKRQKIFIIEDRKLADIGNTSKQQYMDIAWYADFVTVHALPGDSMIKALTNCYVSSGKYECKILLIGEMSCANNLFTKEYTRHVVDIAKKNRNIVAGFISQHRLSDECDGFLHFTPGVRCTVKKDKFGQKYRTPQEAVMIDGCDFVIVGRGIYQSGDKVRAAAGHKCMLRNYIKQIEKYQIINETEMEFTLKCGKKSNIYADFRLLMGYPQLFRNITQRIAWQIRRKFEGGDASFSIVGVPMGGIPFATLVSQHLNCEMIMLRPKRKTYGKKNMIEGREVSSQNVVIIEDVLTTGGSVLESIEKLEEENLRVLGVFAILDRECGAVDMLNEKGYYVETVFALSDFSERDV